MANRRMFSNAVIGSDSFLDLPLSSQALYFHLISEADDDGFCDAPKKIQRMLGASPEDLRILTERNWLIGFDSGVVVIRHWLLHNTVQKDRKVPTIYVHELFQLKVDNGVYELGYNPDTDWIQNGSKLDTQDNKSNISQVNRDKERERESENRASADSSASELEHLAEKAAAMQGKAGNRKYIQAILRNWKTDGRGIEEIRRRVNGTGSGAHDYQQHEYTQKDWDSLDARMKADMDRMVREMEAEQGVSQ